jgi:hypothetical protein
LLICLMVFAGFVLPVHSIPQRLKTIIRIVYHWLLSRDHVWFINDGAVPARDSENSEPGPGVIILDAASAAVFQHLREPPRAYGPGVIFTRSEEFLVEVMDLRRQVLLLGPRLGEQAFAPRAENEPRPTYHARQYRRQMTAGLTRDGVEIVPTLRVVYAYDGAIQEDGTQFGYSPESMVKAARTDHPPPEACRRSGKITMTREETLTCMISGLWHAYLESFDLQQLFCRPELPDDSLQSSGLNGLGLIVELMRQRLTQPEAPGLDAAGKLDARLAPSQEYQALVQRGLRVHEVSLEAVQVAECEQMCLLQSWQEQWGPGVRTRAEQLRRQERQVVLQAYGLGVTRLLKDRLRRVISPLHLEEALLLMLRGTRDLCPAGSTERGWLDRMVRWVEGL